MFTHYINGSLCNACALNNIYFIKLWHISAEKSTNSYNIIDCTWIMTTVWVDIKSNDFLAFKTMHATATMSYVCVNFVFMSDLLTYYLTHSAGMQTRYTTVSSSSRIPVSPAFFLLIVLLLKWWHQRFVQNRTQHNLGRASRSSASSITSRLKYCYKSPLQA